ncbi:Uncharacterized protein Tcan_13347 [Toxocara canis]|uniref:MSP domain-containing protein n=2 Tax=Toxocara canis TaxID=6265 RepID=A0A0B2VBY2_TOXCA|nr:Uncharacterized protein Tcan_13347 [Toxocara canis]VDM41293.1 unnamed protein product [Toxocara canis]
MSTKALAVVPPTCPISAAGGVSKHKLVNQCAFRMAFKVKSSNNSNYTVTPNMGIVEVGSEVPIEITRSNGKPKADRLVILFEAIGAGNNDYKSCFAPGAPKTEVSGEFVVKLSAAE